jgi:hypothetical protein
MSPSVTPALRATFSEPRWRSVAEYPSGVAIASVLPPVGTVPANVTVPLAGATTGVPGSAPMSMPRWRPPAYGSEPKLNPRKTGPCTGQAQPRAVAGATSAAATAQARRRLNIDRRICCQFCKPKSSYQVRIVVVKSVYREAR